MRKKQLDNFQEHYNVVNDTLMEIDKSEKPTIVVFNKIDAYSYIAKEETDLTPFEDFNYSLKDLQKSWMSKLNDTKCIFISAATKENFNELKSLIYSHVKEIFQDRYPYHNFLY